MKDCCGEPGAQRHAASHPTANGPQEKSAPVETACVDNAREDPSRTVRGAVQLDVAAGPSAPASPPNIHIGGDDCCSAKEQEIAALGAHGDVKRVLQIVLAINLIMFVAEFTAGVLARSTALMADSVDMFGDALVYMLSLYALNRGLRWRAGAAVAKGGIIAAFGVWVMIEAGLKLVHGVTPVASTMFIFGLIALAANLTCLALLYRYRKRDVNMSSTFECSRNDVISNTGVLLAAGGVYATGAAWPDILVGAIIALLFFGSAIRVLREAWPQFRSTRPEAAVSLD